MNDLVCLQVTKRSQQVGCDGVLLIERERQSRLLNVNTKCLSRHILGDEEVLVLCLARGIELSARYAVEMSSFCLSRSSGAAYGSAWYMRIRAVARCPTIVLNARYST